MPGAPFTVPIRVRSYEIDSLGHVNQAVYHQYAEHGRMEMLAAAKFDGNAIAGRRIMPVLLESTMKYLRELTVSEEISVITNCRFAERKVFYMDAEIVKADGVVSATLTGVFGFLDLDIRKLMPSAREVVEQCCAQPDVLLT